MSSEHERKSPVVLHAGQAPVYTFLGYIETKRAEQDNPPPRTVLDCGAGGERPPLAVFAQQGYECWGIDISREAVDKAAAFCREHSLHISFQQADMRRMPFADASFSYVFEQFAMVHMVKSDLAVTLREMHRVLRPGGLCFCGVISTDTWPMWGKERESGEYWWEEHGEEEVVHCLFDDDEADALFADWEIIRRLKIRETNAENLRRLTPQRWAEYDDEVDSRLDRSEWDTLYPRRELALSYTHVFYILQKRM